MFVITQRITPGFCYQDTGLTADVTGQQRMLTLVCHVVRDRPARNFVFFIVLMRLTNVRFLHF